MTLSFCFIAEVLLATRRPVVITLPSTQAAEEICYRFYRDQRKLFGNPDDKEIPNDLDWWGILNDMIVSHEGPIVTFTIFFNIVDPPELIPAKPKPKPKGPVHLEVIH